MNLLEMQAVGLHFHLCLMNHWTIQQILIHTQVREPQSWSTQRTRHGSSITINYQHQSVVVLCNVHSLTLGADLKNALLFVSIPWSVYVSLFYFIFLTVSNVNIFYFGYKPSWNGLDRCGHLWCILIWIVLLKCKSDHVATASHALMASPALNKSLHCLAVCFASLCLNFFIFKNMRPKFDNIKKKKTLVTVPGTQEHPIPVSICNSDITRFYCHKKPSNSWLSTQTSTLNIS